MYICTHTLAFVDMYSFSPFFHKFLCLFLVLLECFASIYKDICFVFFVWTVAGLWGCAGAFCRCSVRAFHWGGFPSCRALALGLQASVAVAHGLACPQHGLSPDQGSNSCPCVGRWTLNHWTTREVLIFLNFMSVSPNTHTHTHTHTHVYNVLYVQCLHLDFKNLLLL